MKFLSLLSHKPTSLGGLVEYLCPDMMRGVKTAENVLISNMIDAGEPASINLH